MDRAPVLGTVEPLEGALSWVRAFGRRAVEDLLEPLRQRREGVACGSPCAGRRHHTRAELPHHAFGDVGFAIRLFHHEPLERKVAGQAAIVVAAHADLLDDFGVGGGGAGRRQVRRGGLRSRTGGKSRGGVWSGSGSEFVPDFNGSVATAHDDHKRAQRQERNTD